MLNASEMLTAVGCSNDTNDINDKDLIITNSYLRLAVNMTVQHVDEHILLHINTKLHKIRHLNQFLSHLLISIAD